jgi:hypothetical protein
VRAFWFAMNSESSPNPSRATGYADPRVVGVLVQLGLVVLAGAVTHSRDEDDKTTRNNLTGARAELFLLLDMSNSIAALTEGGPLRGTQWGRLGRGWTSRGRRGRGWTSRGRRGRGWTSRRSRRTQDYIVSHKWIVSRTDYKYADNSCKIIENDNGYAYAKVFKKDLPLTC